MRCIRLCRSEIPPIAIILTPPFTPPARIMVPAIYLFPLRRPSPYIDTRPFGTVVISLHLNVPSDALYSLLQSLRRALFHGFNPRTRSQALKQNLETNPSSMEFLPLTSSLNMESPILFNQSDHWKRDSFRCWKAWSNFIQAAAAVLKSPSYRLSNLLPISAELPFIPILSKSFRFFPENGIILIFQLFFADSDFLMALVPIFESLRSVVIRH